MTKGLVALVTNATHFVGVASAKALAAEGARVVCHDLSFSEPAAGAAFSVAHPGVAITAQCDPDAALADVETRLGPLDVLVSNDFFLPFAHRLMKRKSTICEQGWRHCLSRPIALLPPQQSR